MNGCSALLCLCGLLLFAGGQVVDFHSCDFMPERWFQLVIVLRTDNQILYPRLQARSHHSHSHSHRNTRRPDRTRPAEPS